MTVKGALFPVTYSVLVTNVLQSFFLLKVHNVFPKVTFPPSLHPVKIQDLARGIMRNGRKQSVLSNARSSKHSKSKTTSSVFVFTLSPTCR